MFIIGLLSVSFSGHRDVKPSATARQYQSSLKRLIWWSWCYRRFVGLDNDKNEDENQVRDRGHLLQLLPVHAARNTVLVWHVRTHWRGHIVSVWVSACRSCFDVLYRTLRRVHHHLLAGANLTLRQLACYNNTIVCQTCLYLIFWRDLTNIQINTEI